MNKLNKAMLGLAVVMVTVAGSAGMASADAIDDAISTTQTQTIGYATAALAAVVAVVLIAIGIKVVPKVIRAVAARVTG